MKRGFQQRIVALGIAAIVLQGSAVQGIEAGAFHASTVSASLPLAAAAQALTLPDVFWRHPVFQTIPSAIRRQANRLADDVIPKATFPIRSIYRRFMFAALPKKIALIGPPGAGKGTHGLEFAKELGLSYFSTGDFFRDKRNYEKSELLTSADRQAMDSGGNINFLTADLIVKAELEKPRYRKGYVVDGWPRSPSQLQTALASHVFDLFIIFNIDWDTYRKRAAMRRRGPDDEPDVVATHIRNYDKDTKPIVDMLEGKPNVIVVDSDNPQNMTFRNSVQSIRYVYQKRFLAAIDEWLRQRDWHVTASSLHMHDGEGSLFPAGFIAWLPLQSEPDGSFAAAHRARAFT